MKRIFSEILYVALMVLAYMAFQGLFTFLAMVAGTLYAVLAGALPVDALESVGELAVMPGVEGIYVWSVATGLLLSTVAMLLFIHVTKGYRIRSSVFRSMTANSLFLSTMLIFSAMFALNIFVQWFELEDLLQDQFKGLTHNPLGIITISLLAPLLEEVLFRGAIQGYLMRRHNPWTAIVCAALAFGILHWNPVQTLYATLLGVVFGWIYYRTGSLLSVIVGPVLNNSLATVVMLLFGSDEPSVLPAGVSSPAAETISEIVTFLFFAFLSLYFAVRLHRSLPSVQTPWRDFGGEIR